MHTLRLFCKIVKYKFAALIEYPGAYVAGIIAQWLSGGADMLIMFLMIWSFGSLAGLSPDEIIFMYAIGTLSYSLGAPFTYDICRYLPRFAVEGTLDETYIRPVRPFIYLMATNFNFGYIAYITLSITALTITILRMNLSWTFFHWAWFLIIILAAAVIQSCTQLLYNLPALKTRTNSPVSMLFWQGRQFTQYPLSIYPRAVQFLFVTALPFGFIAFYPSQVLLGKQDGVFANILMWLSPFVAGLLVLITMLCWVKITKNYESAGT